MTLGNGTPTAERPLLLGILVDVSGSMLGSINNAAGRSINRLESVTESLDDLVERAAEYSYGDGRVAPRLALFAYGFGFGNPLSVLLGGPQAAVRDLLELPGVGTSTVTIDRLSENWPTYRRHVEQMVPQMLGATPMLEGFTEVERRLTTELSATRYSRAPTLFVVSDGDPTDAQPHEVAAVADRLKQRGVLVVSCYVTEHDVTAPRQLYGRVGSQWSPGAQLMFHCASTLPADSSFSSYLNEYRWAVEPGARLFTQINQSEVLSEFLSLVLSPLSNKRPNDGRTRVFVSYAHEDEAVQADLLNYLSGLSDHDVDLWSDHGIRTGQLWDDSIRAEIERCDIALVLVSQYYLNSKYVRDNEISGFLRRRRERGLVIYPVILSACSWEDNEWLAQTQYQPRDGMTLDELPTPSRLRLYKIIRQELKQIAEDLSK